MSTQAISAASLIFAGSEERSAAMRLGRPRTRDGHDTEFRQGMLERSRKQLAKGEMLAVPAVDATLVCLEGELWLTRDGDPEDYILGAGSSMHLGHKDQAMVQALRASQVRLIGA